MLLIQVMVAGEYSHWKWNGIIDDVGFSFCLYCVLQLFLRQL